MATLFSQNVIHHEKIKYRPVKYELKRACKKCENIDLIPVTKLEAAFELYDSSKIYNTNCSKCDSKEMKYLEHAHPKLDKEIIDLWGSNNNYRVSPQDEEIILAELENLELITNAIDENKYLSYKQIVLLQALCVLLYDYSVEPNENYDLTTEEINNIIEKIRPELIKRKSKIKKVENWIMGYIKLVVFPQIDLDIDQLEATFSE